VTPAAIQSEESRRAQIVQRIPPAAPIAAAASLVTALLSTPESASGQEPITGYAPVNDLRMYYEIHGSGSGGPLVLLHGALMAIPSNWGDWIDQLAKRRRVIAVELQGHGRTADIDRPSSSENLADDVAALLDHLEIPRADVLGYSLGGTVAIQFAIRHPDKVRKVVSL